MEEKEIQKIQDEIMNQVDKNLDKEDFIDRASKDIASRLLNFQKVDYGIEDREYAFRYKLMNNGDKKFINLIVADIFKFKLVREKYVPYTVNAEMNENFSIKDNLTSIIEAFLRHVLDLVKPQEL